MSLYIIRRENDELWVLRQQPNGMIYTTDINKARRFNSRNARKVAKRIGGVVVNTDELKGVSDEQTS